MDQSQTFDVNGTWTAPAHVISPINVQCWAAGGGGGTHANGGGGGGGGGYAEAEVEVTPGAVYDVIIGLGGAPGADGDDSYFEDGTAVRAGGGSGTSDNTGGTGGAGIAGTTLRGGGGGGGGGSGGYGILGPNGGLNGGTFGAGSGGGCLGAGGGGGVGGDGGGLGIPAEDGTAPGGGGGGSEGGTLLAGSGANGRIIIQWHETLVGGTITRTGRTTTSISLIATEPTGGEAPYTYQWQRRQFGEADWTDLIGQTSLSLVDTGLTEGTLYEYRVQYSELDGNVVYSEVYEVYTRGESAFLADLATRRGRLTPGHLPVWFMERWGATVIEPTAFEPDPTSYRHDYYYNATTNALYKRVITRQGDITVAKWQKVSD
jgi:hypothetical protein